MSTIEERVKKIVVEQLGVKEEEATNINPTKAIDSKTTALYFIRNGYSPGLSTAYLI